MTLVDSWETFEVPPDLVRFGDGENKLVVNPELAAWALLGSSDLAVLEALAAGRPRPPAGPDTEVALANLVLRWLVYLPGRRPTVRQPESQLKMVYYAITDGCNLRCPYCYASSEKCLPNELGTAESLDLVEQVAALGVTKMVFTGGEPMLRKDLFTVAAHAVKLGMQANIITNATLIRKPEIARKVADTFATVTVSVDGGNAELHEYTRGRGTFAKTVNALRMLNACGVRPLINHVVTDRNVSGLPDLGALLADIDVTQVRLMHHSGLGRGADDANTFGWAEYQQAHEFVWTHPTAQNLLPDGPLAQKPCSIRKNCGMGGTEIYVNSLGEVYPCKLVTGPEHRAGSIRTQSLADLYRGELLADLRTNSVFEGDNLLDCRKCYIRSACGGGCRAYHLAQSGDIKRNARAFCRVLRHQMVTSMWVAAGAGRETLLDNESAFTPILLSDASVHPVYRDWQTQQLPPRPLARQQRRLLPIVT